MQSYYDPNSDTYLSPSQGTCDRCTESGRLSYITKEYYDCKLPGCGRKGVYRTCIFHRDDTYKTDRDEWIKCSSCQISLCRNHQYICRKCYATTCRHHRHWRCIAYEDRIKKEMNIIGNKYMINLIIEYLPKE